MCADRVVYVQYVDYAKGEATGFLRFDVPEDAQKLRAAAAIEPEGALTISKYLVTFEALEGTILCSGCNILLSSDYYCFMSPIFVCSLATFGSMFTNFLCTCRRGRERVLEEVERRAGSEARLWWWGQRLQQQPWF